MGEFPPVPPSLTPPEGVLFVDNVPIAYVIPRGLSLTAEIRVALAQHPDLTRGEVTFAARGSQGRLLLPVRAVPADSPAAGFYCAFVDGTVVDYACFETPGDVDATVRRLCGKPAHVANAPSRARSVEFALTNDLRKRLTPDELRAALTVSWWPAQASTSEGA